MKTVQIVCAYCGATSLKRKAEVDRQIRSGRSEFFCNLSCHGKASSHHIAGKYFALDNLVVSTPDELSDFRWYIARCRSRNKHEMDLTLEYLKVLWEQQNGICPFTKIKLILRRLGDGRRAMWTDASLDRINSSKGYVMGNVRFVSLMYNIARNTWSDDDVMQFCTHVYKATQET